MSKFAHFVLVATVVSAAGFASVSFALPPSDHVAPDPKPAPSASAHPAPSAAPTTSAPPAPTPTPSTAPTPPAAPSAPTPSSGPPCVHTQFGTELVRHACAVGGQDEAKDVMKAFMKDKKIKSCNQCHTKLAPKYELKADGLEQSQKAGGK